jgi:hypothetical protein
MRGLDAWIESGNHHHTTQELGCETCGHIWEADCEVEYGSIISDHTCPECGSEEWTTADQMPMRWKDEG